MELLSEPVLQERAEAVLRALLEEEFPDRPVRIKAGKPCSAWSPVHRRTIFSVAFRSRVYREARAVLASTGGKILAMESWQEDPANCPALQAALAELQPLEPLEISGEALAGLERLVRRALLADVKLPADEPRPLLSVSLEQARDLGGRRIWLGRIFEQLPAEPSIQLDARDASLFTWNLPHRRRPRAGRLNEAQLLEKANAFLQPSADAQFSEMLPPERAGGCFRVIYERFVDGFEVEGDFLMLDMHPADGQPIRLIRSWSELKQENAEGPDGTS